MKNKVNNLSKTKSENKTTQYVELAKSFAKRANEIAKDTESFMIRMAEKEVLASFRKAEQADCEYTAYANAHSAEVWLEKMESCRF